MNSRISVLIGALVLVAIPSAVQAQEAAVEIEFGYTDDNNNFVQITADDERVERLNLAHCLCASEGKGNDDIGMFQIQLTRNTEVSLPAEDATLTVGSNCNSDNLDSRKCIDIESISDVENALRSPATSAIRVDQFISPTENEPSDRCILEDGFRTVYVLFDDDGDDTSFADDVAAQYDFDTEPPPAPGNPQAQSAEEAVRIQWELPTTDQDDVEIYQVLCAKAGENSPVFSNPNAPEYDTPNGLCDSETTIEFDTPNGDTSRDAGSQEPDAGVDAGSVDAGSVDAGTGEVDGGVRISADVPEWMKNLDPSFICGTSASSSSTSIRIGGLENFETYRVALLVVDKARNLRAIDLGEATPAPVTDFWEDYDNRGGSAEGGLCLVTSTFGDDDPMTQALRDFRDHILARSAWGRAIISMYYAQIAPLGIYAERHGVIRITVAIVLAPVAGLAAFWEYTGPLAKLLVLLGLLALAAVIRHRRAQPHPQPARRTRYRAHRILAAAAVTVLGLVAGTRLAAAQPDPYWEVFQPVDETAVGGAAYQPQWNIGIKLGPYLPNIDDEFGDMQGPFERIFGGAKLMGIAELEWFFLWPLGQLGVTASTGYTGTSANAIREGCPPTEDCPDEGERSEGDTTAFRLIPTSVGLVYRFTGIDDQWRIPLVPYAKAGLSYYLWWVNAPDGDFAETPTMDCLDPSTGDCEGNQALGASLGWQASLGLAIRLERIDPQSAISLRNDIGIDHAGIYGEVTYADVDSFGSDNRLSVGDLTWFAGFNFEF